MKSTLLLLTLFVFGFTIMSFYPTGSEYQNTETYIQQELLSFREHLLKLQTDTRLFQANEITPETLQATLKKTRNSYKEIEFYIAYHYPEFSKTHLNAAPLFHIEATGTAANTVPPEGLQVLDEIIFSDTIGDAEKDLIVETAAILYNNFNDFYLSSKKNGLSNGTNKTIPLRLELIKIYTMGITGFDTPGSLNVFEESIHALSGMLNYIRAEEYFRSYNTSKAELLLLDNIDYLSKNNNFDTFDRIQFYKNYLQPLYEEVGKWDNRADDLKSISGWNIKNVNFFSSDFLDPYSYTLLKKEEDSDALRALGKMIFYDRDLSNNNKMSCASCHLPENAFTDLQPKSLSNIEGRTVLRNSPSLYNAVFAKRFFYDMRAFYLEQQVEHVIYNEQEFNTSYGSIIEKLNKSTIYKRSFKKAFKSSKITKQNFSKALSSYVASLHSFDSDFDQFMRNEKDINEDAKKGYNLFMGKANCATCHYAPLFSGLVPPFFNENESEVLRVTRNPLQAIPIELDPDRGRIMSTVQKEKSWIYENSFKTMTVRNAALTKPYFHNGAFSTLEEVINFYNEGGAEGMGVAIENQTLSPEKLNLNQVEINQLIAFINTLTDISKTKE
ncbi:cytochrome-c peroxidase [Flavobacterium algicola]|uniref:cytochrome-c peroxidase n=1 Tax=Flavobacterium algicola TaxID=556529 RepID=UPI001EFE8F6E|nr:cytochrome c peroxidase [Flavobacterium algicola]MCG9792577.1 cytochrome-c peroxidase [Flavobacterium algicola]